MKNTILLLSSTIILCLKTPAVGKNPDTHLGMLKTDNLPSGYPFTGY